MVMYWIYFTKKNHSKEISKKGFFFSLYIHRWNVFDFQLAIMRIKILKQNSKFIEITQNSKASSSKWKSTIHRTDCGLIDILFEFLVHINFICVMCTYLFSQFFMNKQNGWMLSSKYSKSCYLYLWKLKHIP